MEAFIPGRLAQSLRLIRACGLRPHDPILFAGGGCEPLIEALLAAGCDDLTVVNASREALETLCDDLHGGADKLTLVHQDITQFRPHRRYAIWYDGGVFHYFTHPDDRQEYIEVLQQALRAEGYLVIAAFGPRGPCELAGVPVMRYSAAALLAELGAQFELAEHLVAVHRAESGEEHQYLHGRFRRHAPRWPG